MADMKELNKALEEQQKQAEKLQKFAEEELARIIKELQEMGTCHT
jgi:uncharacterized FlaG/YvyC family protein